VTADDSHENALSGVTQDWATMERRGLAAAEALQSAPNCSRELASQSNSQSNKRR